MNISGVRPGDLVRCDVNGWRFIAEVRDRRPGELEIEPIGSKATYRKATARQVVEHWRKSRKAK
jgi:hypothetical protein